MTTDFDTLIDKIIADAIIQGICTEQRFERGERMAKADVTNGKQDLMEEIGTLLDRANQLEAKIASLVDRIAEFETEIARLKGN